MNGEIAFVELFQRLIQQQQLSPKDAEELLQRILEILTQCKIEEHASGDG